MRNKNFSMRSNLFAQVSCTMHELRALLLMLLPPAESNKGATLEFKKKVFSVMYIFTSLLACVFWKILRFHKIKGKKKGVVQTSESKLHLFLVHEFTNHAGLSVKFTHHIVLVVLVMHHKKRCFVTPSTEETKSNCLPLFPWRKLFPFYLLQKKDVSSHKISVLLLHTLSVTFSTMKSLRIGF